MVKTMRKLSRLSGTTLEKAEYTIPHSSCALRERLEVPHAHAKRIVERSQARGALRGRNQTH